MAPSQELLNRTVVLKRQLLDFSDSRRFHDEFDAHVASLSGSKELRDPNQLLYAMDAALLDVAYSSGRTLVEHFVDANPKLPKEEREMLLSWRKARQGVFRIDAKADQGLVVYNLVDDLTYRAYSNVGPDFADQVEVGWYLLARLVPIGQDWLFSGGSLPIFPEHVDKAYQTALKLVQTIPSPAFQNPKLLEIAWETQRDQHRLFIEHFGSDIVILPRNQFAKRMNEFLTRQLAKAHAAAAQSAPDRTDGAAGTKPAAPAMTVPAGMETTTTIGVISDEIEGIQMFPNMGDLDQLFRNPRLKSEGRYAEALDEYLQSPDIDPLPLRRIGDRELDNATDILRDYLEEPDFEWTRDRDQLLRDFKPLTSDQPPLPAVSSIPDELARFMARPTSSKHPGRNDPCPCGSGRKFKHCHGKNALTR